MDSIQATLKQILPLLGTPDRPLTIDGEALWSVNGSPIYGYVGKQPCVCSLIVAKDWVFRYWTENHHIPNDFTIFMSPFPAETKVQETFAGAVSRSGSTALFLSDLDPMGVLQRSLCNHPVSNTGGDTVGVCSGGIDDIWLELIEVYLNQDSINPILIPLSPAEHQLLAAITDCIDVASIVGERGFRIMSSGSKIELEGATNLKLYREGYLERIFEMLRDRCRPPRNA
jgi:hypothetical protein